MPGWLAVVSSLPQAEPASTQVWAWVLLLAMVAAFLGLDLGVLNRRPHVIGTREALGWTSMWVSLALGFGAVVYFAYDRHWFGLGLNNASDPLMPASGGAALVMYLTGYVVEQSLSLDNMFVIAMVFTYFKVPGAYQHRVLFWGILGAIVFRGIMIWAGYEMVERFSWTMYFFAGLLVVSAIKMLTMGDDEADFDRVIIVRLARALVPVSSTLDGQRFFTRLAHQPDGPDGATVMRLAITPLMLVLLVVESADVLFAVDSVPAIFGITHDPFLVYSSNIFAILGLRSLYFALASLMGKFRFLKIALVLVLFFIGVKMILHQAGVLHMHPLASLGVIFGTILSSIVASLVVKPAPRHAHAAEHHP